MKHIHAEIIKAWADGSEIQIKNRYHNWKDIKNPTWHESYAYRIKSTSTSDYVHLTKFVLHDPYLNLVKFVKGKPNIKLIFDSETKKLKSAEVLK